MAINDSFHEADSHNGKKILKLTAFSVLCIAYISCLISGVLSDSEFMFAVGLVLSPVIIVITVILSFQINGIKRRSI